MPVALWSRKLVEWFEREHRPMPWRTDPSPYKVWISEVMLQQTQVVTVIPYFDRFIARFPGVQALAGIRVNP
jgi:A/G-specific adenine glycosylase